MNISGIRPKAARKLHREAIAALMRMHDQANDEFRAIKRYFEQHIERMLQQLVRDGQISKDAPLPVLVGVLYVVAAENYYRMIANEFRPGEDEKAAIQDQVRIIFRGWIQTRQTPSDE